MHSNDLKWSYQKNVLIFCHCPCKKMNQNCTSAGGPPLFHLQWIRGGGRNNRTPQLSQGLVGRAGGHILHKLVRRVGWFSTPPKPNHKILVQRFPQLNLNISQRQIDAGHRERLKPKLFTPAGVKNGNILGSWMVQCWTSNITQTTPVTVLKKTHVVNTKRCVDTRHDTWPAPWLRAWPWSSVSPRDALRLSWAGSSCSLGACTSWGTNFFDRAGTAPACHNDSTRDLHNKSSQKKHHTNSNYF